MSEPIYWFGLLLIVAPATWRILQYQPTKFERIGILLLVGLTLYGIKIAHSPLHFTFHDELVHWRTTENLLQDQKLFSPNALLPTTTLYPGLSSVTSAIADLTSLTTYQSGLLVIGSARALLILSLFWFYMLVSHSFRLASVATLLYMANPSFVYFSAQFAYESLAVPVAVATLALLSQKLKYRSQMRKYVSRTTNALPPTNAAVLLHVLTHLVFPAMLVVLAVRILFSAPSQDEIGKTLLILVAFVGLITVSIFIYAIMRKVMIRSASLDHSGSKKSSLQVVKPETDGNQEPHQVHYDSFDKASPIVTQEVNTQTLGFLALGLLIITVAATHHLTSYALIGFLLLWAIMAFIHQDADWRILILIAAFAVACATLWLFTVARFTVDYLSPYFLGAIEEVFSIIRNEAGGRQLFQSFSGVVTPLGEQLLGYASVILLLAGAAIGSHIIIRLWRRQFTLGLETVLLVASIAYPASLGFRLTYWGVEASNRLSGYVFIPLAFVVASGVTYIRVQLKQLPPSRTSHHLQIGVNFALTTVILITLFGGIVVGWPQWARIPGPYLVSADMRSVDEEGILAGRWAQQYLPTDARLSADRVNSLLMGSYGDQRVVTIIQDGVLVAPVFFAEHFGDVEQDILQKAGVGYLLIDERLATGLPYAEVYFERGEPNEYRHREPISLVALSKFDSIPFVERIYDSGNITIYDVSEISR